MERFTLFDTMRTPNRFCVPPFYRKNHTFCAKKGKLLRKGLPSLTQLRFHFYDANMKLKKLNEFIVNLKWHFPSSFFITL